MYQGALWSGPLVPGLIQFIPSSPSWSAPGSGCRPARGQAPATAVRFKFIRAGCITLILRKLQRFSMIGTRISLSPSWSAPGSGCKPAQGQAPATTVRFKFCRGSGLEANCTVRRNVQFWDSKIANGVCNHRPSVAPYTIVIPDLIRDPGFLPFSGSRIESEMTIEVNGTD